MKPPNSALQLVLLPLFLSVSPVALAADLNWSGDDAYIDAAAANFAVVDGDLDGDGTPELNLAVVGRNNTDELTIQNGALVKNTDGYIAYEVDSVGTVIVAGER